MSVLAEYFWSQIKEAQESEAWIVNGIYDYMDEGKLAGNRLGRTEVTLAMIHDYLYDYRTIYARLPFSKWTFAALNNLIREMEI